MSISSKADVKANDQPSIAWSIITAVAIVVVLAACTFFAQPLLSLFGISLPDKVPNSRLSAYDDLRTGRVARIVYEDRSKQANDVAHPTIPEPAEDFPTDRRSEPGLQTVDPGELARVYRMLADERQSRIVDLDTVNKSKAAIISRLQQDNQSSQKRLVKLDEAKQRSDAILKEFESRGLLSCKVDSSGNKTCQPTLGTGNVHTTCRVVAPCPPTPSTYYEQYEVIIPLY